MQVAQSMSRCASAGERDERALSPARRDVDVSHALDTIGFRIEIVGCAQSRFPNCRTAGAFGEFPVPRCKFPQPRWIAAHWITAGLPNGLTINSQGGRCRACASHKWSEPPLCCRPSKGAVKGAAHGRLAPARW
jgi:hypothetical protein